MDTQGFVAGPLSVLCIVALVMGTASAAVIATTAGDPGTDTRYVHQHSSPESIISFLEKKGVDVTELRALLQAGDTAAVKAWLEAHRPEKPDGAGRSPLDLTNPAQQEKIITRLEAQGVDVTELKGLLQAGDTSAVKAWLEAHWPERPDAAGRSPPDLTDPAIQQKIITRLEERGVDVNEVEAELQAGDTTAVQTWLESYQHSHEGEMGFHHPRGNSLP